MDNQQATDAEIGWLAGIIDGEGWLGMTVSHEWGHSSYGLKRPRIIVKCELKITNCDAAIIERSALIIAKLGVNPYRRTHKKSSVTRRPVHEAAFKHMAGMQKVLPVLLPHLTGIKRQRAELILRFIALRQANPGIPRPGFDTVCGKRGPRTIRPYSDEELAVIEACRDLQSAGASETTRETRARAVKALTREHALRHAQWEPEPEMI
jgi:hypothetical protein